MGTAAWLMGLVAAARQEEKDIFDIFLEATERLEEIERDVDTMLRMLGGVPDEIAGPAITRFREGVAGLTSKLRDNHDDPLDKAVADAMPAAADATVAMLADLSGATVVAAVVAFAEFLVTVWREASTALVLDRGYHRADARRIVRKVMAASASPNSIHLTGEGVDYAHYMKEGVC